MITFYSRDYEVLAQASFDRVGGLVAYDDTFEKDLETGLSTYTFTIDKLDDEISKIGIGNYVRVVGADGVSRWFEVLDTEENSDYVTYTCIDGGLDLIGETVDPYKATESKGIREYFELFLFDSGWEIGKCEIPNDVTRKLEYEGNETSTKRLRQVARAFGAEIEYEIESSLGKPTRKLINIIQRIGSDKRVRLEYGREVSKITKKASIQHLATGLRAIGVSEQPDTVLDLQGYSYHDGRYFTAGGALYDMQEGERWKRMNATSGGYIMDTYQSQAKTVEALFQETLAQLKKRAYPEVEYTVDFSELPEEVEVGDSIVVVDYDYKPALKISARVSSIKYSLSKGRFGDGTVVISNVHEEATNVDERLKAVEKLLREQKIDYTKFPPVMTLFSSKGTVFMDDSDTTLTVKMTQLDTDVTDNYTYKWKKQDLSYSKDSDKINDAFNSLNKTGARLELSSQDIGVQSEFICEAFRGDVKVTEGKITLKNLQVKKYRGETPPDKPSTGDLWTDTTNPRKEVTKIYSNGQWVPVINDLAVTADRLKQELEIQNKSYSERLGAIINEIELVKASEKYTRDLTGRFGDLDEAYKQILQQAKTIEGLEQRQKALEINLGQSAAVINALSTYFNFSEDGLIIGKSDSNLKIKIDNDDIEYIDGGKVTSSISGQQVTTLSGNFIGSTIIGNHNFEKFGNEFTFISYVGGKNA